MDKEPTGIYLARRHYVNNPQTLSKLEGSIEGLCQTKELGMSSSIPMHLSLILSHDPDSITMDLRERYYELVQDIKSKGITTIDDPKIVTAGEKFLYQLIMKIPEEARPILALSCLDQYDTTRKESMESIMELASKMIMEDSLYSTGSRSIPTVLGVNKQANDYRTIHELIHSITGKVFKTDRPEWATPSKSYDDIGESTSGFYMINPKNSRFQDLKREILMHPGLYENPGFSIDYFSAVWSAINSKISTGYVHTLENYFPTKIAPDEELKRVSRLISNSSRHLSQTSVAKPIMETLSDTDIKKVLEQYFDKDDVQDVISLMIENIREK